MVLSKTLVGTLWGSVALLASPADAVGLRGAPSLNIGTVSAIEMHTFRSDCGRTHALSAKYALKAAVRGRNPGAGMSPASITPFDKVFKDGYLQVTCVKDEMFSHGDKFHDNKFEYTLGERANVSIVHYDSFVAKEDRQPMSHEVCFDFCRTIPEMIFFGLQNGRACYCTPYYEAMESDSSQCDSTCPGNPTLMCGGKTKSSIFAMHQCDSTMADLLDARSRMVEVQGDLDTLRGSVSAFASAMQGAGMQGQQTFGKAGDPVAADLFQTAKVFAGELSEASSKATAMFDSMAALGDEAAALTEGDMSAHAAAAKAEAAETSMKEAAAKAVAAVEELQSLASEASPNLTDATNASGRYYPVMYFVDRAVKDMPSTCGGDAAARPMLGSMDLCARACDNDVHECVGFSFFEQQQAGGNGICFLFSKLTSATYYTKCGGGAQQEQQQQQQQTLRTACVVKFADFEGVTLKPDPSGKCKACLKEVTKADRCYS